MKRANSLVLLLVLFVLGPSALAQGTAFTYQGRLVDSGTARSGIYDLRFTVYDALTGGAAVAGPVTNAATVVSNGLFTATVDAGAGVFTGGGRWLEIGVRTNGSPSDFAPLTPRQPITATPYAMFSAASGSLSNGVIQNPLFLGTTGSTPLELMAGGQRALRLEPNAYGSPNVIGGSLVNQVDPGVIGATIGGGGVSDFGGQPYSNRVSNSFGTVGGGIANFAQGFGSVIGGGVFNSVQGFSAGIAGGYANNIQEAQYAAIGGGNVNLIRTNAQSSYIGAGYQNVIQTDATFSSIVGGEANAIGSPHSFLGGGQNNVIEPFSDFSAIGGGLLNVVHSGADQSVIAGGNANKVRPGARESFIGGGFNNIIETNAGSSFVGGGANNSVAVGSFLSTIGGGSANTISNDAQNATVGGGFGNTAAVRYATVGGGYQNFASGNFNGTGDSATVAGGYQNAAVGNNSVVAGGWANYARGDNSSILGGGAHTNLTGYGFIGGGYQQTIEPFSRFSVIAGGESNEIHSNSTHSVIAGGQFNNVGTNAPYATIAGGSDNLAAGTYSFAAGRRAKANHQGTFVWADSTNADFTSSSSNQFLIRASGGVGIGVTNPSVALEVAGAVKATSFQGMGAPLTFSTTDNQPLEFKVNGTRVLRLEPTIGAPNILGGFSGNYISNGVVGGTIAGGGANGASNAVSSSYAAVGGGYGNVIEINSVNTTIAGGRQNRIGTNAFTATIAGGDHNIIEAGSFAATIAGGAFNDIQPTAQGATISGGAQNLVGASGDYGVIAGGLLNTNLGYASVVGGGINNRNMGGSYNVLGGGWDNVSETNSFYTVMGGGRLNQVGVQSFACSILSGYANVVQPYAESSVIGGGRQNQIDQFATHASLLGGSSNVAHGNFSSVGGGFRNSAGSIASTVPGGSDNNAAGNYSFAAGQRAKAFHQGSFVWADSQNADFLSSADDQFSIRAAGGVRLNSNTPLFWSTGSQLRLDQGGAMELGDSIGTGNMPYIDFHYGIGSQQNYNVRLINDADGQLTLSGNLGFGAQTRQMLNLYSAAYGIGVQGYRMYFRADGPGGFAWFVGGTHNDLTDNPGTGGTEIMKLESNGNLSIRGVIAQNVLLSSDRDVKAGFEAVDSKAILAKVALLPITRWHYTNETATAHIGPVAQDFSAAFELGSDDKHIATVDANGVALAAIQGLHQMVKDKDAKIAALEERLAKVERLLSSLANAKEDK